MDMFDVQTSINVYFLETSINVQVRRLITMLLTCTFAKDNHVQHNKPGTYYLRFTLGRDYTKLSSRLQGIIYNYMDVSF